MPRGVPAKPRTTITIRLELSEADQATLTALVERLGTRMGALDDDQALQLVARSAMRMGAKWMLDGDQEG